MRCQRLIASILLCMFAPVALADESPAYEVYDLHVDHLGSVRLVTREDGLTVARHDFFPFGEEVMPLTDLKTKMFTGHERDDETGLDYMLARYYSNQVGRFLTVDPSTHGTNTYSPLTWNRYAYAGNDPVNMCDPDGRTVESALGLIRTYRSEIIAASKLTGGFVSPTEIARVVFQENRNDFNVLKNADFMAMPLGGPELKNLVARTRFLATGKHGSFGIGEMRTDTAAKLLGYDPANLTKGQRDEIAFIFDNPELALALVAAYLAELKAKRPDAPTDVILSDYNRGPTDLNTINEVGSRSWPHLESIGGILDGPKEKQTISSAPELRYSCEPR